MLIVPSKLKTSLSSTKTLKIKSLENLEKKTNASRPEVVVAAAAVLMTPKLQPTPKNSKSYPNLGNKNLKMQKLPKVNKRRRKRKKQKLEPQVDLRL
jgi:hypothetical protein